MGGGVWLHAAHRAQELDLVAALTKDTVANLLETVDGAGPSVRVACPQQGE